MTEAVNDTTAFSRREPLLPTFNSLGGWRLGERDFGLMAR